MELELILFLKYLSGFGNSFRSLREFILLEKFLMEICGTLEDISNLLMLYSTMPSSFGSEILSSIKKICTTSEIIILNGLKILIPIDSTIWPIFVTIMIMPELSAGVEIGNPKKNIIGHVMPWL